MLHVTVAHLTQTSKLILTSHKLAYVGPSCTEFYAVGVRLRHNATGLKVAYSFSDGIFPSPFPSVRNMSVG